MTAPPGATAEQAIEGFVLTAGIADFIGENCWRYGIRKNFRSEDQLIEEYVWTLIQEGYRYPDLVRATENLSQEAIDQKAIQYVMSRGAREDDLGSLCRVGLNEIAAGTSIGRLLRTVS